MNIKNKVKDCLLFLSVEMKSFTILVFKRTNLHIALTNTLNNLLAPKPPVIEENRFHCSGMYQLTGLGCGKKYTGQTHSTFEIRYEEQLEITIPTENLPSIS